jgi:uncharacterized protein
MTKILKPKATAVWLIDNTTLTFEQIAQFCGMHSLEIKAIADGEVAQGIMGENPVNNGQLSREEIHRCEKDQNAKLELSGSAKKYMEVERKKVSKYTPVARRQDKPDAITWITKHFPEVTDAQIVKLIGTTKATIGAIRNRTHWNITNIKPRDPVLLGLCSQMELDRTIERAKTEHAAVNPVKE